MKKSSQKSIEISVVDTLLDAIWDAAETHVGDWKREKNKLKEQVCDGEKTCEWRMCAIDDIEIKQYSIVCMEKLEGEITELLAERRAKLNKQFDVAWDYEQRNGDEQKEGAK